MLISALLSAVLLPTNDIIRWEQYDLAHLTCLRSESYADEKNQLLKRDYDLRLAGDTNGLDEIGARMTGLCTFNVRSQFRTGKVPGGLGRLNTKEMAGLFSADTLKPNSSIIPISLAPGVPNVSQFDPWLKESEEGYWWVRRGAAKVTDGDDWAVVTDKRELAALVPFPELVGPFGDPDIKAPRSRNHLPTEKESKAWAAAVVAVLGEPDATARRKKLLGYTKSDNEILGSWAVHVLTRMPADDATAKAVRKLLDAEDCSLLVVVTTDRYLARHRADEWASSAERKAVLVRALQRLKPPPRQVNQLLRHLILGVSPVVVMPVLTEAYKGSDEWCHGRWGLMDGVTVIDGLLPPSNTWPDVVDLPTIAAFYKRLTGNEYPKFVRERAQHRLNEKIFSK